jgi:NleD-like pathogen effector protein (putative zinc metallopeptidase)
VGNNPLSIFDTDGHTGIVDAPQDRRQVQSDIRRLAPGTRVDSTGTVRNGNLLRRVLNHLTGHGAGQALATRIINAQSTVHISLAPGSLNGSTSPATPSARNIYVSYDPSGSFNETRTSSASNGAIASILKPGALTLGHELIHATHIANGTLTLSTGNRIFSEGSITYSETARTEEFRTIGFSGYTQKGDITEQQLRHESGLNDRATYRGRPRWTQQTP